MPRASLSQHVVAVNVARAVDHQMRNQLGCLTSSGVMSDFLVDQARLDPLAWDGCSDTPVTQCYSLCRNLSLPYPSGVPKRPYRSKGGVLQGSGYRILFGCLRGITLKVYRTRLDRRSQDPTLAGNVYHWTKIITWLIWKQFWMQRIKLHFQQLCPNDWCNIIVVFQALGT